MSDHEETKTGLKITHGRRVLLYYLDVIEKKEKDEAVRRGMTRIPSDYFLSEKNSLPDPSFRNLSFWSPDEKESSQDHQTLKASPTSKGGETYNEVDTSFILTNVTIKDKAGKMAKIVAIIENDTKYSTISDALVRKFGLTPDMSMTESQDVTHEVRISLEMFYANMTFAFRATVVDYLQNDVLILGTKQLICE